MLIVGWKQEMNSGLQCFPVCFVDPSLHPDFLAMWTWWLFNIVNCPLPLLPSYLTTVIRGLWALAEMTDAVVLLWRIVSKFFILKEL